MTSKLLHEYAVPDAAGLSLLKVAMQRLNLSARAYDRILKVSRTIADLEASSNIEHAIWRKPYNTGAGPGNMGT